MLVATRSANSTSSRRIAIETRLRNQARNLLGVIINIAFILEDLDSNPGSKRQKVNAISDAINDLFEG